MNKNTISTNYSKSLVSSIILLSVCSVISCWEIRDTGLLKDRVIRRRHQQELGVLLGEIGVDNPQQALSKIRDLQTLLDTLQASSVNQAQQTIEHLRTEYGSTIQNMQDEIQQVLNILNAANLNEALKKINKLQNSYNQIIQFAQNLDRPKNTNMPAPEK